jgi:hypothetical protein
MIWVDPTQDGKQWRAVVNKVLNIHHHYHRHHWLDISVWTLSCPLPVSGQLIFLDWVVNPTPTPSSPGGLMSSPLADRSPF